MNIKSGPIEGHLYYHTNSESEDIYDVLKKVGKRLDETSGFSDSSTEQYYNPDAYKITITVEKL